MYQRVPSDESMYRDNSSDDDQEKSCVHKSRRQSPFYWHIFVVILVVSLLLNVFSIAFFTSSTGTTILVPENSKYASLERNVPRAWHTADYANETEQDELWEKTNYDRGNIALDDSYAKDMGLPRAQRFPWDLDKGIYLINAYHNLHCVKTIRTAVVEFKGNTAQSSPYLHVIHCLNVLRDEIMCDADDTPRYTGFQPNQKSGLGQQRMCRDWTQLEAYADEHHACWRHVGEIHEDGFRELDRYRFCPEGSPYAEMARTKWLKEDTMAKIDRLEKGLTS